MTGYDEVSRLLADGCLTSQTLEGRIDALPGLAPGQREELDAFFGSWLSLSDGTPHRVLRRSIAPLLAPARVAPWGPALRAAADRQAAIADPDRIEWTFARPYAATAIGLVLGLRADEVREAVRAAGGLVRLLGSATPTDEVARGAHDALRTMTALAGRIRMRRPEPEGPRPLLHDSGLSPDLEVAVLAQLVAGGFDPLGRCLTAYLSSGVHPGTAGGDDPLLEEIIRVYAPFDLLPRIAVADREVAGCPIPAGSRVLLAIGSANREETRFPGPEQMRRGRTTTHLAFGGGRHRCPAAGLARLALGAALAALAGIPAPGHRPPISIHGGC